MKTKPTTKKDSIVIDSEHPVEDYNACTPVGKAYIESIAYQQRAQAEAFTLAMNERFYEQLQLVLIADLKANGPIAQAINGITGTRRR